MNNKEIEQLIKNNEPSDLLSKLSPEETQFLNSLLNDSSARERFLSSKEAAEIIKMLKGNG